MVTVIARPPYFPGASAMTPKSGSLSLLGLGSLFSTCFQTGTTGVQCPNP